MMNVLVVTDKLDMGGAENYFCKLENELSHPEIDFYYAAAEGELCVNLQNKKKFSNLSRKNHLHNLWVLKRIIRENSIGIYHANSLRMVFYGLVLKWFMKERLHIFYTKHNVTQLEKYLPLVFRKILNRFIKRIITVSDFEKFQLIDLAIDSRKIKTIYNGVDLQQFAFQRKKNQIPKKVGILARISKEKNQGFFLEVAEACLHHPDLIFYIAGDGPDYQSIQQQIIKLGIEDKVQMIGAVHTPERFLKDMDVLLVTSHREVFPMVVLESMAVGTPIISINRGGINEAIENDKNGYLLQEHSKREFSCKIEELLSNDLKRLQFIKEARKKVETAFSLQKMIQLTLNEYLLVLNEKKGNTTSDKKMHKPF
ncbi:glycosyltransferase family 4 protein [Bacillus sp. RO1]|uniref:glycosyltransferase family 4 protein n=1 Tax=Bacillus sp. RO1 TaxID=2722703 RepID=UPI00145649EC|nr:glycosyltransferase family 4 protein [Bacillus sp. RO1]NLP51077.1 glycosyltransferase family 4 protein [Bacillus sp. RO1]